MHASRASWVKSCVAFSTSIYFCMYNPACCSGCWDRAEWERSRFSCSTSQNLCRDFYSTKLRAYPLKCCTMSSVPLKIPAPRMKCARNKFTQHVRITWVQTYCSWLQTCARRSKCCFHCVGTSAFTSDNPVSPLSFTRLFKIVSYLTMTKLKPLKGW